MAKANKNTKKATQKKVARKKSYKGIVIADFSVGYKSGTVKYKVGDTFETENLKSLNHLINIQKLKK